MKNNLIKIITILLGILILTNCSNGKRYADLNREYNRKNGTQNRNMALDTIIATTLYNYPEIGKIGSKKTKTRTSIEEETHIINNTDLSSPNYKNTEIHTNSKSKTKSKSISTEFNIVPFLYLLGK